MPILHRTVIPTPLLSFALMALAASAAGQAVPLTPAQWRADIEELHRRLPVVHADLFHQLPGERFQQELVRLATVADTASGPAMLVGIARAVAAVGDGHTSARILRPEMSAFPVLTQVDDDGLRIRRVEAPRARLLGSRVIRIQGRPVEEVLQRVATVISADNAMGVRAWTPFYLVTREVLLGLGLMSDDDDRLVLDVERTDGAQESASFDPLPLAQAETLLLGTHESMVDASQGGALTRDARTGSYWDLWLPEHRTLFVRIDRLIDTPERSFAAFVDSLMLKLDARAPDRLVLDLRSLSGGNHIALPLIHGLIRRPAVASHGRLFVLIGRGTFSAGQNLVSELERHLEPIFIGEPTGGRPNHFGVLGRFKLPNSGLEIRYSRFFNQDADPADYRHWQEPHVLAPPDLLSELEGRDPALEAALAFGGRFRWSAALHALEQAWAGSGLTAALEVARARWIELRTGGWQVEEEVNRLGYRLLRTSRTDDAIAVLKLNVELFPDRWNTWDSLGEALLAGERIDEAKRAYERSLELNGYNRSARRALQLLALRPSSPPS
jgi:hypothetical protein